jgi:hypothetical protein
MISSAEAKLSVAWMTKTPRPGAKSEEVVKSRRWGTCEAIRDIAVVACLKMPQERSANPSLSLTRAYLYCGMSW